MLTESELKTATSRLPSVHQMRLSGARKNIADAFQALIHTIESLPEGDLDKNTRAGIVEAIDSTFKVTDFALLEYANVPSVP